ncbi:MAG: divergent polysaccharide deacetylase family protein [Acidobacteriota bacterium]
MAAAAVVAGLAAAALVVLWLSSGRESPVPVPDPGAIVAAVAARHGCAAERVAARSPADSGTPAWAITVHAPRGFDVARFQLDLEAEVHNLGGRIEPRSLTERGGYGLARLEGEVGGEKVQVLVLGEPPPEPRARRREKEAREAKEGLLAIVLDDAGYALDPVREIARLPGEVAVAVLPNAPHSSEVARALGAQGRELLVHMPMEPLAGHGPGPGEGAVLVGQDAAEIERRVEGAFAVVAGAVGLNNHMGSRATADAGAMRAVMASLKSRGAYFLDSRTTADTVAERTARSAGVPALRRSVFLDVADEPSAVRAALREAAAIARSNGRAVAIGHVQPVTLEVLAQELDGGLEGVRLVRPSRLLRP